MANDLTPALFGLLGAAIGGVGSTVLAAASERSKFKSERMERERAERRRFRIDTLQEYEDALEALMLAVVRFRNECNRQNQAGVAVDRLALVALQESFMDAKGTGRRRCYRLHDVGLRSQCIEAMNALTDSVGKDNDAWSVAVLLCERAEVRISEALRDLYDS
jgi:hypothetical protein